MFVLFEQALIFSFFTKPNFFRIESTRERSNCAGDTILPGEKETSENSKKTSVERHTSRQEETTMATVEDDVNNDVIATESGATVETKMATKTGPERDALATEPEAEKAGNVAEQKPSIVIGCSSTVQSVLFCEALNEASIQHRFNTAQISLQNVCKLKILVGLHLYTSIRKRSRAKFERVTIAVSKPEGK